MKNVFILLTVLLSLLTINYFAQCGGATTASIVMNNEHDYFTSSGNILFPDTNAMLNPIPEELLVSSDVNDSDVVFITKRCVVHSKYSENELMELEKHANSVSEWEVFYDNYSFYNDDVSMYIYERSLVITESDKKYIQFVMASGIKITIDRKKSAGKLFFFNPETGVKQCDSFNFDRRRYENF